MTVARKGHDAFWAPTFDELVDLLGRPVDQLLYAAREAVTPDAPEGTVHRRLDSTPDAGSVDGAYGYVDAGLCRALVGKPTTGAARSGRLDCLEPTDPLVVQRGNHQTAWPDAIRLDRPAPIPPGSAVRRAGSDEIGTVVSYKEHRDALIYTVRFGSQKQTFGEDQLTLVPDELGPADWASEVPMSAAEVAVRLTATKLVTRLSDTVYSYGATRTMYRAYQFRPLLRMLDSSRHRLLIADEVGLGKTIEAGLIWTELDQRVGLDKVLIVCPASLRLKWEAEMRLRFDRTVDVLDAKALRNLMSLAADGKLTRMAAVVSIETLRGEQILEDCIEAAPTFDLVIVDEAHVLRNSGTQSNLAGQFLSDAADALVFLSATPLNLGTDDLYNLVSLLNDDDFPDRVVFDEQLAPNRVLLDVARSLRPGHIEVSRAREALAAMGATEPGRILATRPEYVELSELIEHAALDHRDLAYARRLIGDLNVLSSTVSRTRRADVADHFTARRTPRQIEVEVNEIEAKTYLAFHEWARRRALRNGGVVGFATVMPLRQAASCLPAVRAIVERNAPMGASDVDGEGDLQEVDVAEEGDGFHELGHALLELLDELGETDSKFDAFVRELTELRAKGYRQVMVFSFFRATLEYLHRRLGGAFSSRVMHGGVKPPDREPIMAAFRRGEFDILLVSEVGSEGLDFEFCSALINYDLPWNPMKVEQRIGRIDRFGQQAERLAISNFVIPGTIETDILMRLYNRIRVFEESIGELEPILRDEFAELERAVLDPKLTADERREEMDRIATAAEQKRADLADLTNAEPGLAMMDDLLVEDLEERLSAGGFVGQGEIKALLTSHLRSHNGSIRDVGGGIVEIRGSEDVITVIGTQPRVEEIVKRHAGKQLMHRLADATPILATFDPDTAAASGVDLLSSGHPLVMSAACAVTDASDVRHFACLAVANAGVQRVAVVLLAKVETTGLRPSRELWPIAIDLDKMDASPELGDELLAALATSRFVETSAIAASPDAASAAIELATEELFDLQMEVQSDRQRTNDAMVDAQIAARRASFETKIAQRQGQLARLESESRAESLIRMQKGAIRNLATRRDKEIATLEARKGAAVSVQELMVLLVDYRT